MVWNSRQTHGQIIAITDVHIVAIVVILVIVIVSKVVHFPMLAMRNINPALTAGLIVESEQGISDL